MKTEGLEKKLSEILDELHKYSPYAWEQMVSYEFADAAMATFTAFVTMVGLSVALWFAIKKADHPEPQWFAAIIFLIAAITCLCVIASNITIMFHPEAAVLRRIFR